MSFYSVNKNAQTLAEGEEEITRIGQELHAKDVLRFSPTLASRISPQRNRS